MNEVYNPLVKNLGLDNSRLIAHDSYNRSGPLVNYVGELKIREK